MDLLFCDLKDWNMFFFKYVKDVLYVYGDEVRGLCASLNSIVLRRWRRPYINIFPLDFMNNSSFHQ